MRNVPRIRGRTGVADEGEHKGKWFYEISLWDLSGEREAGPPFQFGPFDDEKVAGDFGRNKVRELSEYLENIITGEKSGRYFDLKNGGIMRPWDEN
jgi:hypothetical protein